MAIFNAGDEVAILPSKRSPPKEVFEIAIVAYAGPGLVELTDGRFYFANDRQKIALGADGWIVRVTEEHQTAYRGKLH
jgi:hypothetical protein